MTVSGWSSEITALYKGVKKTHTIGKHI